MEICIIFVVQKTGTSTKHVTPVSARGHVP